ncbi:MAG: glycosyltransferase family A protein [bacterium]|nr:glycosyltransferase family A protein [bacterium]
MQELISIIIPVFNHANILRRCFVSIAGLTYAPVEIIVVNDGSTDNFDTMMAGIINEYPNLKIVAVNQSNRGAPSARNVGLRGARGNYVIFWDADTIANREILSKMMEALKNNPLAVYAYSDYKFGWKKMLSQSFDREKLKQLNYIDVTSLIHREALSLNPFDETLKRFQDWDLWLTLLEQNKTGVYVPGVLYKKIIGGRAGISQWLPKLLFKLPLSTPAVRRYEAAREIVLQKHGLWRAGR